MFQLSNQEIAARVDAIKATIDTRDEEAKTAMSAAIEIAGSLVIALHNIAAFLEQIDMNTRRNG